MIFLAACAPQYDAERFEVSPAAFADLPGFASDNHAEALEAFLRSCDKLDKKDPDDTVGNGALARPASRWQFACDQALAHRGAGTARQFFEEHFTPYRVIGARGGEGLFTGYYEPLLHGSRTKKPPFTAPIYRVPPDLNERADERSPERAGKNEAYFSRAEIDNGALEGKGLEIAWVDSKIDAFFLQVQGSGRIEMEDGSVMNVGYAGKNGHPYEAIGRILVDEEGYDKEDMTLFTLRDWLAAHPERADELMQRNPSYVFFRVVHPERAVGRSPERAGERNSRAVAGTAERAGERNSRAVAGTAERAGNIGPLGAQGIALTPERSLAIDSRFIPYGTPVYLDTTLPETPLGGEADYRRLLIAQDRGGAIKGGVRGDVFFGHGARAEILAGHMKQPGRYWLLLPKIATGE